MMYMLDTNICIYAIKNKPEHVLERIKSNIHHGLCISAITLAELQHGVEKSAQPEKNTTALLQFLSILSVFALLLMDSFRTGDTIVGSMLFWALIPTIILVLIGKIAERCFSFKK